MDVLTAHEADMLGASDEEHLAFALREGRLLFTQDADFLRLHSQGVNHAGIAYAPQQRAIGDLIRGLTLVCETLDAERLRRRLEFI